MTYRYRDIRCWDMGEQKPPVVPSVKVQGGFASLQGLRDRLFTLGDGTKAASLATAVRSALRAIPLLERRAPSLRNG
jgi:hypothetical protein